jgi:hypothetical protein
VHRRRLTISNWETNLNKLRKLICYGSRSPDRRHVRTVGKKDYFLLLSCWIHASPPFIDGGDLRAKQPHNPNPRCRPHLTTITLHSSFWAARPWATSCYGSESHRCRHVPTTDKKDYFLLLACWIHTVRINCIGLLGLHHLFYKGSADPLGLQLCASPGAASPRAATPGAASPGADPRGSPPPYKSSHSPFNRIIQFHSYSSPLTHTSPPTFIDGGDLRPKQPHNPNPRCRLVGLIAPHGPSNYHNIINIQLYA